MEFAHRAHPAISVLGRAAAALLAALAATSVARADVLVTPLRAVVTPETPQARFRISNPSDRIISARIGWAHIAATDAGGYAPASDAQNLAFSAAPYLSVTPAHAVLEPGAATTVCVSLRDGAGPPEGERRGHLLVEATVGGGPMRTAGLQSASLDMSHGVSVPVILRAGRGDVSAKIAGASFRRGPDGGLELLVTVARSGGRSAYGRLVAVRIAEDGRRERIARLDNVAIFTEQKERRSVLALGRREMPSGRLEVRYEGAAEYEGRVFAARAYDLADPSSE